jgi:hypothetical protein
MNNKTAGKRYVKANDTTGFWDVHEVSGAWIAQFESQSDAELFAAAPELLEALRALTDPEGHIWHGPHSKECTGECKAVRGAIAKAEGRET